MYRKILIMLGAVGLGVSVAACSSTGPGRVLTDFRGLHRADWGTSGYGLPPEPTSGIPAPASRTPTLPEL